METNKSCQKKLTEHPKNQFKKIWNMVVTMILQIEFVISIDMMKNKAVILSQTEYLGQINFYIKDKKRQHIMIVSLENLCSLHPEEELLSSFWKKAKFMDGLLSEMKKLFGKMYDAYQMEKLLVSMALISDITFLMEKEIDIAST